VLIKPFTHDLIHNRIREDNLDPAQPARVLLPAPAAARAAASRSASALSRPCSAAAIVALIVALICGHAPLIMGGTAPSWAHLCNMIRNSVYAIGHPRVGNSPTCNEARAITDLGVLCWVAVIGLVIAAITILVIDRRTAKVVRTP
jgi:hypothetical protein